MLASQTADVPMKLLIFAVLLPAEADRADDSTSPAIERCVELSSFRAGSRAIFSADSRVIEAVVWDRFPR